MRRGELWTAAGGTHYAGKPRPVVVLQSDLFGTTASVTVCPLTSNQTDIPLLRIPISADSAGLSHDSRVMIDKVTTMPRAKLREWIGEVTPTDMLMVSRAVAVFLGVV